MKFKAEIDVMPHKEILDPQGKAVKSGLNNLGLTSVEDVRIGKHIVLFLEAENQTEAEFMADSACKKLLANEIMEGFSYKVLAV
jgi:phosphoribosylformylglycinamidine synthase subunit PurS